MRIDLYATTAAIPPAEALKERVAVVIDVLRATTTITTALENGAQAIIPLLTPQEAFRMVKENPGRRYLLGGERQSIRIDGFHFGNSPLEYSRPLVEEMPILFTTTNGTRAIHRAAGALALYIGCLRNAPALAQELIRCGADIALCCAGTDDQFSLEDIGCAGAIAAHLRGLSEEIALNDLGHGACDIYNAWAERLDQLLARSAHGQSLLRLGLHEDLRFCAAIGATSVLPRYEAGQVTV